MEYVNVLVRVCALSIEMLLNNTCTDPTTNSASQSNTVVQTKNQFNHDLFKHMDCCSSMEVSDWQCCLFFLWVMSSQRVISRRDTKKQLGMSHEGFADENANNSICQSYLDPQAHQRPDAMISNQAMSSLHPMQRVSTETSNSADFWDPDPISRYSGTPFSDNCMWRHTKQMRALAASQLITSTPAAPPSA